MELPRKLLWHMDGVGEDSSFQPGRRVRGEAGASASQRCVNGLLRKRAAMDPSAADKLRKKHPGRMSDDAKRKKLDERSVGSEMGARGGGRGFDPSERRHVTEHLRSP